MQYRWALKRPPVSDHQHEWTRAVAEQSVTLKRCSRKEQCLHPEGPNLPATPEYFMPHKGKLYCQCHYCRKEAKRQSHINHREHNNNRTQKWVDENREYKREQDREYYLSNRAVILERVNLRRLENPEKKRASNRRWYWSDPEKRRETTRQYHAATPELTRHHNRLRKARERGAGGSHTLEDVRLLLKTQKGLCWWCGKELGGKYHVDHRIPITRGGSNNPRNLVLAHPKCNLSKGAKLPSEWIGRLL